jgi:hypothetical protein
MTFLYKKQESGIFGTFKHDENTIQINGTKLNLKLSKEVIDCDRDCKLHVALVNGFVVNDE